MVKRLLKAMGIYHERSFDIARKVVIWATIILMLGTTFQSVWFFYGFPLGLLTLIEPIEWLKNFLLGLLCGAITYGFLRFWFLLHER